MTELNSTAERRTQAGVVPYRETLSEVEFCLITTGSGSQWGFPKGFVEDQETVPQAALKEALEEAGLHGQLRDEPLGRYTYQKRGMELEVTVFLMKVQRWDEKWLESDSRQRRWCRPAEAERLLAWHELRELLQRALARLEAE